MYLKEFKQIYLSHSRRTKTRERIRRWNHSGAEKNVQCLSVFLELGIKDSVCVRVRVPVYVFLIERNAFEFDNLIKSFSKHRFIVAAAAACNKSSHKNDIFHSYKKLEKTKRTVVPVCLNVKSEANGEKCFR